MAETTETNKAYFDKLAAEYDSKFGKSIQQITTALQEHLDFIGAEWVKDEEDGSDGTAPARSVRLLDYACGTGLVSRALAPYITQSVGVDVSENMIGAYNTRAENQGLSRDEMFAVKGDLLDPQVLDPESLAGPEFHEFDVAAVGLGFHHFADPEFAAKRLTERLRVGGVLFIVDFMPHGEFTHAARQTVVHMGFGEDRVKKIFEDAGAGKNFHMKELGAGFAFGHGGQSEENRRRVFIARGEKA